MIDGARILVVEDDAAINKVVCSYLGKLGAECGRRSLAPRGSCIWKGSAASIC